MIDALINGLIGYGYLVGVCIVLLIVTLVITGWNQK